MADQDGPKPARERLEAAKAAKAAASDAEIVSEEAGPGAKPAEGTLAAAETPKTDSPATDAPADSALTDPAPAETGAETPEAVEVPDAPEEAETPPPAEDRPPEPAHGAHEHEHEEAAHRPLSAIILQWLVVFFIGAAAALWAGPKIAPHLPAWAAPVAGFLTPGANQTASELAALRAETEAAAQAAKAETETTIGALRDRIAALESGIADAAQTAATATVAPLEARIGAVENAAGAAGGAALDALSARVAALESAPPAPAETPAAPADGAPAAAVSALQADIAALRGRIDDMGALASQDALGALDARVAALESGQAATASAQSDAERIRREANLDAAMTRIGEALLSGAPYEAPLQEAVSLSGQVAPEALTALAETGAPTARALARSFPAAARQGYAATIEAEAGDGFGAQFLARIEGRIGGRPATETPGDDAGAVLSRVEARLAEGRIGAAAKEAAALPETARAAMSAWLGDLDRAAAAAGGLTAWRATLGVN